MRLAAYSDPLAFLFLDHPSTVLYLLRTAHWTAKRLLLQNLESPLPPCHVEMGPLDDVHGGCGSMGLFEIAVKSEMTVITGIWR